MRYAVSVRAEAVVGPDLREPLAGAVLYLHGGQPGVPGGFRIVDQDELDARPLLAEAGSDADGVARLEIPAEAGYDGGLIQLGARITRAGGRGSTTVDCVFLTLTPRWTDGDPPLADVRYAVPESRWAQVRLRLGRWVIGGYLLSGTDGAPIGGAQVTAFDTDLVQDDR